MIKLLSLFLLLCSTIQPMYKQYYGKKRIPFAACHKYPMFLNKTEEIWIAPFSWGKNPDIFEGKKYQSNLLTLFVKNRFFLKSEIDGIRYTYQSGNCGFVESIRLNENWRGQGLGYLLLCHALAEMDEFGVKTVQGSVGAQNHAVIALNKKCGFVFHSGDIHAGHIMQKRLSF